MSTEKDKKVQELVQIVQERKIEISKAEKPNWITNCSFGYIKDSPARINIQVLTDINEIISILAFLIEKEQSHQKAAKILNAESEFKWMGFSLFDWQTDLQTRINKIQISKKKQELEVYENKLNSMVSKEYKEQLELDQIIKGLGL